MNITKAVLDASVVIKWFRTFEPDCQRAILLREKFLTEELSLAIPELLLYEIANVLRYKPDLAAPDVISIVHSVLGMRLEIKPLLLSTLSSAISFGYQYDITVYDAIYFSLAQEIGYSFITADEVLYEKIKETKFVYLLSQI